MLENATEFIIKILMETDEVQSFPKDFVEASANWIRSWFLADDVKTEQKLIDPNRTYDNKMGIIEMKIEALQAQNSNFLASLEEKIKAFEIEKQKIQPTATTLRNVVQNSTIHAGGDVHIGDSIQHRTIIGGDQIGGNKIEKQVNQGENANFVEKIEGNDNLIGNNNQQAKTIINNYYAEQKNNSKHNELSPTTEIIPNSKEGLKILLREHRIEELLKRLLEHIKISKSDSIYENDILLLTSRWNKLIKSEMNEIISQTDANLERNKIIHSLSLIIERLQGF